MFRMPIIPAFATALVLAGASVVGATEPMVAVTPPSNPFQDPVGDATGTAPDIVAVSVSEPEGDLVSFSVEFASEPPLDTDMETWTDVLFIGLATDAGADLVEDAEYTMGTHGVTLQSALDTGGHLAAPDGLYWRAVDIAVDGPTITFSVDRKLIGDPSDLYWRVLVGVEREDQADEEYDVCPDREEPPGVYRLGESSWS